MQLICVAIVNDSSLTREGKRRLSECTKEMYRVDEFRYQCEDGHMRFYPADKWEERSTLIKLNFSGKSEVHYGLGSLSEHLLYLIRMYSYIPQNQN